MLGLLAVAVVVAGTIGFFSWRARPVAEPVPVAVRASAPAAPSPATTSTPADTMVVAVAGRVRHPGIVTLPRGARVVDAIQAAGGTSPGTDLGLLNLARPLADGEQVVVGIPVRAGGPAGSGAGAAGAAGGAAGGISGVVSAGVSGGASGGMVDLNAATADELVALPGIGPVTAQRIVDWRTSHGRFSSVDQLRDVSGIGPAKFAQLRDRVTV